MAGIVGMDVGAVQQIGVSLKSLAEVVDGITNTTAHMVDQLATVWQGPDLDQFRGWWEQQHRLSLQQTAEAVRGLGQLALRNATEQTGASGGTAAGAANTGFAAVAAASAGLLAALGPERVRLAVDGLSRLIDGEKSVISSISKTYEDSAGKSAVWKGAQAAKLGKYFGSASDAQQATRFLGRLGAVMTVAGGALTYTEQYGRDAGYGEDERRVRAAYAAGATVVTDLVIQRGATALGAAIGTLIPVPVFGTAAGAVVGFGLGVAASALVTPTVTNLAAAAGSVQYHLIGGGLNLLRGTADPTAILNSTVKAVQHDVMDGAARVVHDIGRQADDVGRFAQSTAQVLVKGPMGLFAKMNPWS